MKESTRKVIVSVENEIFGEGVAKILHDQLNLQTSQISFDTVLSRYKDISADLIILDYSVLHHPAKNVRKLLKGNHWKILIRVDTPGCDLLELVDTPIAGLLEANITKADLIRSVEYAFTNKQPYYSPGISCMLASLAKSHLEKKPSVSGYSKNELSIFELLAKGLTSKEISNELGLSTRTVEDYKCKLQAKTRSRNTVELVMYAIRNKIIRV